MRLARLERDDEAVVVLMCCEYCYFKNKRMLKESAVLLTFTWRSQ